VGCIIAPDTYNLAEREINRISGVPAMMVEEHATPALMDM